SPDFAAANYTITEDDGRDDEIAITRLPFNIDLMQNKNSQLQLEVALAYQKTKTIFTFAGGNIDSKWTTYGAGLGLLYNQNITNHLEFTPSFRFGLAKMEQHLTYKNTLVDNSKTNASVFNFGVGLKYNWKIRDRASNIRADVYHVIVDSFDESNLITKFKETSNMIALQSDIIFPSNITIYQKRLDFLLLLGANNFFGENRNTLGYTTSYQVGTGVEFPLSWESKKYGYLRFSGQILRAKNMKGWILSIGYNQAVKISY
ncbi:MAG: autotransporter outer membrane beta-barrel domain-containing protein, partial [Thiohalomonadales bacterium]